MSRTHSGSQSDTGISAPTQGIAMPVRVIIRSGDFPPNCINLRSRSNVSRETFKPITSRR